MSNKQRTKPEELMGVFIEGVRLEMADTIDNALAEIIKRLTRLEGHVDGDAGKVLGGRGCTMCGRRAVSRGMCSAHYQQWRYRKMRGEAPSKQAKVLRLVGDNRDEKG